MDQRNGNWSTAQDPASKQNETNSDAQKRERSLFKKFKHQVNAAKQKELIHNLHNYHGKNFPITYKKQYRFSQKWQESLQSDLNDDYLLEDLHPIYSIICLITVLLNSYTIWGLSFQRYFGSNIATQIIPLYDLMILIKGMMKYQTSEAKQIRVKAIIRLFNRQIICLCFFLYLSIEEKNSDNFLEIMLQLLVIYFLWKESAQIYQRFKIKGETISYHNQLKIFDLLINIFVQAHVFAIFLFSASKIHPQNNWTTAIGVNTRDIIIQYIYSFYFACTTMLTIGYGDITPKNEAEVMVVVMVQIVGVLSFGYLLNEMGHTLSVMRKKQEELEKDLQTVSKMSTFYNLEKKLEHKAKGFLLANQISTGSLKPSDENSLLMKLNEELRTEITRENYLSIVKSSIFFLCNWSKTLQLEVAKRLQKKLVSPNERLGESCGPQKMFIIKKGKLQVYMNRFGSNSKQKKLLKVIKINPLLEVTHNLYGYTVVFSNRPVYLQAVASQFTSTYSITKDQFLECITYDSRDFEYFHQMKCKIDQSQFSEEWEAPAIKNSREHYIPSHIFLICKYKKKLNVQLNVRKFGGNNRGERKKFCLINKMRRKLDPKCFGTIGLLSEKTLQFELADKMAIQSFQDKIIQKKSSSFDQCSSGEQSDESKSIENTERVALEHAKQFIKSMRTVMTIQENTIKREIYTSFEKQRSFGNFFVKNNLDNVLLKLTRENYLERRYK